METALGAALPRSRFVRVHFPEREDTPVSRVEEVADPLLVLRAPRDQFGRVIMPSVGERLVLSWGSRSGTTTLPAKVVGTLGQPSPCWRLQVEDQPVNHERRAFIRLSAQLPLALRAKGQPIAATLRDLSEGGLRCKLARSGSVEAGDEVEVAVELDGSNLTAAEPCSASRTAPTGRSSLRCASSISARRRPRASAATSSPSRHAGTPPPGTRPRRGGAGRAGSGAASVLDSLVSPVLRR